MLLLSRVTWMIAVGVVSFKAVQIQQYTKGKGRDIVQIVTTHPHSIKVL
jgi:uncharacterized protein YwbE